MGRMRAVRFSYNIVSLPASLAWVASSKVSFKNNPYEKQPGKTAGTCAPIVEGMALVLVTSEEAVGVCVYLYKG